MSHEPMVCEACNADINSGDLGTTTINNGYLCRHHTPLLSEVIAEYNSAIACGNYEVYEFSTLAAMKSALKQFVHELTTRGDCNIAVPL